MTRLRPASACLSGIGLLLLVFVGTVSAQSDSYTTDVAVADRSSEEQFEAWKIAFRRVLLDNSGDKTLLNRDAVRSALDDAASYVAAHDYVTPEAGTTLPASTLITDRVRQSGQATELMRVRFDRERVRGLVDGSVEEEEAADEASRVSTLSPGGAMLWLLVDDGQRQVRLTDAAAVNVRERARELAGAAGIALRWSSGDEEDSLAVSNDTLLALDAERLLTASERYAQPRILAGVIERAQPSGWLGSWLLIEGEERRRDSRETATLDEALEEGLSLLSDSVGNGATAAYRYGGGSPSSTEALIWVDGLTDIERYANVMRFLGDVGDVATVYPKQVSARSTVFAILPRRALASVEAALQRSGAFRPALPPTGVDNLLARQADLALEFLR